MKNEVYIIAEIGINHCGSIKFAKNLINIAKISGANAVKFQTFITEKLVKKDEALMPYQKRNIKSEISQFKMLKKNELSKKDHITLIRYCKKKKIDFISTPYDIDSAKLLIDLGVRTIKIASTDITNIQLIRYLLSKKKKLILSSGATNLRDLKYLFKLIKKNYSLKNISLLHCISYYPAPIESLNLNAITTLKKKFKIKVGFSDHSLSTTAGAYAAALGAKIVEKHITLNRNFFGPDHKASLTPSEFIKYVQNIRDAEKSFGNGIKKVERIEKKTKLQMQKSLIVNKNLKIGEKITATDISSMRPSGGISPLFFDQVIHRKLRVNKKKDEKIYWRDFI